MEGYLIDLTLQIRKLRMTLGLDTSIQAHVSTDSFGLRPVDDIRSEIISRGNYAIDTLQGGSTVISVVIIEFYRGKLSLFPKFLEAFNNLYQSEYISIYQPYTYMNKKAILLRVYGIVRNADGTYSLEPSKSAIYDSKGTTLLLSYSFGTQGREELWQIPFN